VKGPSVPGIGLFKPFGTWLCAIQNLATWGSIPGTADIATEWDLRPPEAVSRVWCLSWRRSRLVIFRRNWMLSGRTWQSMWQHTLILVINTSWPSGSGVAPTMGALNICANTRSSRMNLTEGYRYHRDEECWKTGQKLAGRKRE